jgi:hypothetical protein
MTVPAKQGFTRAQAEVSSSGSYRCRPPPGLRPSASEDSLLKIPTMASNDPGLAPLSAPAEDPTKGAIDVPNEDTPVAPDQFDPKYETTRKEIWSYYA